MAGGLTASDPTVLENVGLVVSKAVGSRRGEAVTIIQVFDFVVAATGLAAVLAIVAEARHRRARR